MEILYLLIFIGFVFFVLSLVIGILKIFWPVLLVLGIVGYIKYKKNMKALEEQVRSYDSTYNSAPKKNSNSDIFEADYTVEDEDDVVVNDAYVPLEQIEMNK